MATNNSKFAPEHKKPGDLILSDNWNAAMQEIVRLESSKVNRQGGDSLQGPLTIESALAADTTSVQLEVKGALKLADGIAVNQFSNDGSLTDNSDSIIPTQKAIKTYVDTAVTNLNTTVEGVFVKGMILMWSGQINRIPTGWALCNGENGTPDLRDKFIVGAGNNYAIAATGGAATVTLTIAQMPAHSHGVNDPGHRHNWTASRQLAGTDDNNNSTELSKGDKGTEDTMSKNTTTEKTNISIIAEGSNQAHENRPPYYALAFIIKK